MEGLAVEIREVGESVEGPLDFPDSTANICYLSELSENAEYGDELYGVKIALEYGINSPELAEYLDIQEMTHIQEGVELMQEDSTDFKFDGSYVRSPLNGEAMVDIGSQGHEAQKRLQQQGEGFDFMVRRTAHDIDIAADNDRRMKNLPNGSTWARFTPYAEEEADEDAAKAGFWPGPKRAFMWLYRKKDDATLETTIITIDQSDVAAFAGVMHEYGTDVAPTVTSHDIPGYEVDFPGLYTTEDQRRALTKGVISQYENYSGITTEKCNIGSKEFIERFARSEIDSLARLQKEILFSLDQNELSSFTKLATEKVLEGSFLTDDERRDIMKMYNSANPKKHLHALKLVIRAHRYGGWESINNKVDQLKQGKRSEHEQVATVSTYSNHLEQMWHSNYIVGQEVELKDRQQLTVNINHADSAAQQGKIKPGCPGGSSFLSQSESEAKESIFGGREKDPKRWMSCPFCKKKEAVKARVCDTDLKCRHCTAEVKGGKVVNKGNGGKPEESSENDNKAEKLATVISLAEKREHKYIEQEHAHEQFDTAQKEEA